MMAFFVTINVPVVLQMLKAEYMRMQTIEIRVLIEKGPIY
jgi:hypothetical protein